MGAAVGASSHGRSVLVKGEAMLQFALITYHPCDDYSRQLCLLREEYDGGWWVKHLDGKNNYYFNDRLRPLSIYRLTRRREVEAGAIIRQDDDLAAVRPLSQFSQIRRRGRRPGCKAGGSRSMARSRGVITPSGNIRPKKIPKIRARAISDSPLCSMSIMAEKTPSASSSTRRFRRMLASARAVVRAAASI